jgi:hypothetical protein
MKQPNTFTHLKFGYKSGFPFCCIFYFTIRNFLSQIIVRKFGYEAQRRFLDVARTQQSDHTHHILCPIHLFLDITDQTDHKYYWCHNCKWYQYKKNKCNKCGESMIKYMTKYERLK